MKYIVEPDFDEGVQIPYCYCGCKGYDCDCHGGGSNGPAA